MSILIDWRICSTSTHIHVSCGIVWNSFIQPYFVKGRLTLDLQDDDDGANLTTLNLFEWGLVKEILKKRWHKFIAVKDHQF